MPAASEVHDRRPRLRASRGGSAVEGHRILVLPALLLTILLQGCTLLQFGTEGTGPLGHDSSFELTNSTAQLVKIILTSEGESHPLVTLDPGKSYHYALAPIADWLDENGCTNGDLVALRNDGTEVARRSPPMCKGETWTVVEPTGTASPAPSQ